MNQKPISLKEFKHWLSDHQDGLSEFFNINREQIDKEDEFAGKEVRSKVGESKLLERINTDDDPVQLVQEFLESGGTVLVVEDKNVSIEVESGEFTIPRFCVKIKK
jgi:arsenate reductase-like glutaredoxin family protein